jgi:hypothetical protein
MPFLVDRAINVNLLKESFINHIISYVSLQKRHVVNQLRYLWVLFAKLVALIFKKSYTKVDLKNLDVYIIQ